MACSVVASSLLRRLQRCFVGASFFFLPLPSFFLSWLFLLARVCRGVAARWRRAWECARATGAGAFIAGAPSSNGGRLVMCRAHQAVRVWWRRRGAKETGSCSQRDPLGYEAFSSFLFFSFLFCFSFPFSIFVLCFTHVYINQVACCTHGIMSHGEKCWSWYMFGILVPC